MNSTNEKFAIRFLQRASRCRNLLRYGAIGAGGFSLLAAVLLAFGALLGPEVDPTRPEVDPEELAAHRAWFRERGPDEAAPSLVLEIDYAQGEAAPWYPKGEAPALAGLVEAGQLPPVAERVGPEPMVMAGPDGLGRYGGTWTRAVQREGEIEHVLAAKIGSSMLVRWSPMGYPIAPNVAKSWEASEDYRVWTVRLRRGMRWSDGHPFTTEDVMYWWEHEMKAFDQIETAAPFMVVEGEVGEIEALDAHTLEFRFPKPYSLFVEMLLHRRYVYSPKHYMKPYHPELGDPELIETKMEELHLPTRRALYSRLQRADNPEHPRLWPWIMRRSQTGSPQFAVRNPYFCAVDEAGNQLPYIDRIMFEIKSPNLITQAAASGALTMQKEHLSFDDYTLLMEQRERGGYEVYHWQDGAYAALTLQPNQTRLVDPARPETRWKARLLADRRFRQALSLAIDRERIIEAEYSGFGEPAQPGPPPSSPFYYPPLLKAYADYDPEGAAARLDALGLDGRDGEGYRTFPDGSRMSWLIEYTSETGRGPLDLVMEDFRRVGLRVMAGERPSSLLSVIRSTMDYDIVASSAPPKPSPVHSIHQYLPHYRGAYWGPGYGQWFTAGGYYDPDMPLEDNMRVPPAGHSVWEGQKLFDDLSRTGDLEEQKAIFRRIFDLSAESVPTIGLATPPPAVAVVDRRLRNVPREMLSVVKTPANGGPELFYFSEPADIQADKERLADQLAGSEPLRAERLADEGGAGALGALIRWLLGVSAAAAIALGALRHPFVARRLIVLVPTLAAISLIVFSITQLPPGSYVDLQIMQAEMSGDTAALEQAEQLREIFPLDEPFWTQYAGWLGLKWFVSFDADDTGLLQGDMGRSMENLQPVNELVGERLFLTMGISFGTILFTWLVALPIGVLSAVKKYSIFDYFFTFVGFIGMCIPNFLLALLLMYFSSEVLGVWVSGLFSPEYAAQREWTWAKFADMLRHIWIPIVVLGTGGSASMIRVMRGNLLDELKKPYVTTARAKGVKPLLLLVKYPVRLAVNPFVSGIGGLFPALLSGGAIVAIVMSLPTLGPLQLEGLMTQDYYLAGSLLMLLSLLGVAGTLVSDLLLMWLDPRIRMEKGGSK